MRHRPLQVARAGELDIDVAVIGGSLSLDVGDPAGGLRRRERLVCDHQVDVNIGGGSLGTPRDRSDHDQRQCVWLVDDLRGVRGDGVLMVPHLERPGQRGRAAAGRSRRFLRRQLDCQHAVLDVDRTVRHQGDPFLVLDGVRGCRVVVARRAVMANGKQIVCRQAGPPGSVMIGAITLPSCARHTPFTRSACFSTRRLPTTTASVTES